MSCVDRCSCGGYKDCVDFWCDVCAQKRLEDLKTANWDRKTSAEIEATLDGEPPPEIETTAKPSRYNSGKIEVWDAIEGMGFDYFQGAVTKYVARYKKKNGPEDLVKAMNYCVKMISMQTGENYYELLKLSPEELGKKVNKK